MQMKPVASNVYFPRESIPALPGKEVPGKGKDAKEKPENKIHDKLELSEEAKKIQKSNGGNPKLEGIKEKIRNKFYDSEDVVNNVADKILKEINKQ